MKILLILPAAEHLRVKGFGGYVPKRKMLRFSVLSLTTVAALTPQEHEVVICDENVEYLDTDFDCDVVGITFMTALAPRAYELAEIFRNRGIVTVAGGFHPTLCTTEAEKHFDIVVAGQAEGIWPKVLEDIADGDYQPLYRGAPDADLCHVPLPRRGLTKKTRRHYATIHAVQTGRGCNHKCKFCSVTAFFGGTHQSRPLPDVLEELSTVPKHFMFIDDNIIGDVEYAKELFRAMAPMKKRWISQCSIEIADDPQLLRLAKDAGCIGVFVGIESLSEEGLEAMEKGFNDSASYFERIRTIQRAGIGVQAGMIVGLDSDDVGVFERNFEFLQKAGTIALQLAILTPQPGTPLRDEFEKQGRITDYDWGHYDFRHVVIEPKKMTQEQLQAGADWLYAQYYRLDRIIIRSIRSLFTVGPLMTYVGLRVNLTYRYNNKREGIIGANPAASRGRLARLWERLLIWRTEKKRLSAVA